MAIDRTRRLWPNGRKGPWCVVFSWAPLNARLECVGVEIRSYRGEQAHQTELQENADPVPLSASLIRSVPLAGLIEEERPKAVAQSQVMASLAKGSRFATARVASPKKPVRGGRRRLYGRDHFAAVAKVYADAWQTKSGPTTAVARRWTVSVSTAAKWVARARQMGLLGATQQGRAGGIMPAGGEN